MNKGITEIFKEIPDSRVGNAKKYKLKEILGGILIQHREI